MTITTDRLRRQDIAAETRLLKRAADQRLHAQPQHVRPMLLACKVQQILRDAPGERVSASTR